MAKKVASIGYTIPGNSDLEVRFSSRTSLMDFDIIIFSPNIPRYERSDVEGGLYQGKHCYSPRGSTELREDFAHWRRELQDAIKAGKSVFFLLANREEFFIDTGIHTYEGTGKNPRKTIKVEPHTNYHLLPFPIGNIHSAHGKEVSSPCIPCFQEFYKAFKSNLEYKVYLEKSTDSNPIFTGKEKSKILGSLYSLTGHLILLPHIEYDEESFTRYESNDEEYWNDEGEKFGNILLSHITKIDKELRRNTQSSESSRPEWASSLEFKSNNEQLIQKKIDTNQSSILSLQQTIAELESDLARETFWKQLLYGQGIPLEQAVTEAFKILGYQAENFNTGELEFDQIITSPEGDRFIGECEGKDSSAISIDKFRQLEDNIQSDLQREEVSHPATGILFGNGYRLTHPKERDSQFTEKCLASARRGTILIQTADLFPIVIYLQETANEKYARECRETIDKSRGKIVEFPKIPDEKEK